MAAAMAAGGAAGGADGAAAVADAAESGARAHYELKYLTWADGDSRSAVRHIKIYMFDAPARVDGPFIFAQLRDVVCTLGLPSGSEVWKWWRKHGCQHFESEKLQEATSVMLGDVLPPRKAQRDESAALDPWLQAEALISMEALLWTLCDWGSRLRGQRRQTARALLGDILLKILVWRRQGIDSMYFERLSDYRGVCGCKREGGNGCPKVDAATRSYEDSQLMAVDDLGPTLLKAFQEKGNCDVAAEHWGSLVQRVAHLVEESLREETCPMPKMLLGQPALRCGTRRRRLDQDLLQRHAFQLVAAKRFRTLAGAQRAEALDVTPSTCTQAYKAFLQTYVAAAKQALAGCDQLCVSWDESTVGRESTCLVLVSDPNEKVHAWGVPQVLPALKKERAPARAEGVSDASAKGERSSTYVTLRALDHCLSLYGSGFVRFRAENCQARLLAPTEVRYAVEYTPKFALPEGVKFKRPACLCLAARTTRWETPDYEAGEIPRILVMASDQASVNLAAAQHLIGAMRMRTVHLPDGVHRVWRDAQLGLQGGGLWVDILEALHCIQVLQGPWESSAWFRAAREASTRWLAERPPSDATFRRLAEDVRGELANKLHHMAFSDADYEQMHQLLRGEELFPRRGCRVQMSRWFQWNEAFGRFGRSWGIVRLGLNLLLVEMGVVQEREVPLGYYRNGDVVPEPRTDEPMKRETAKAVVAEQRQKCRGALELAARLMANGLLLRRCKLAHSLMAPLQSVQTAEIRAIGRPEQLQKFFAALAATGGSYQLVAVFARLRGEEHLEYLGFDVSSQGVQAYSAGAQQARGSKEEFVHSALVAEPRDWEDFDMAYVAWRAALRMVAARAASVELWRSQPPNLFAALLIKDSDAWDAAMERARRMVSTLYAVEALQGRFPMVSEMLRNIGWAVNGIVREIFAFLHAVEFQCVPEPALSLIRALFHSPLTTVPLERGFGALEDAGRDAKDERVTRARRMQSLITKQVLQAVSLPEVKYDAPAALRLTEDTVLKEASFDAKGGSPTVPDAELKGCMAKVRDYPIASAQGIVQWSARWALLEKAFCGDALGKLPEHWLALLAEENEVYYAPAADCFYVVLRSTTYAALCWKVEVVSLASGGRLFLPTVAASTCAEWVAILDDDCVQHVPTQVLPPRVVRSLDTSRSVFAIGALQTGNHVPLWVAAAKRGFRNLTSMYLDKALQRFGILADVPARQRPTTAMAKCQALLQHFFPGASREELGEMLLQRSNLGGKQDSLLLNDDGARQSEDALARDDVQLVREGCAACSP